MTEQNISGKQKKAIRQDIKNRLSSTRKNISEKKTKLKDFIKEAAGDEKTYGRILNGAVTAVKVTVAAMKKFMTDQCLTRAASFTYTMIVSLIPSLTVALTIYSVFSGAGDKKNDIFSQISMFMAENNIHLNVEPVFNAISSLVENAGKIGGISAVIMIFSATAMIRTMENALNHIWKVKKQRKVLLKIVCYWAALTLGPILIVSGTTAAGQVSDAFSAPDYRSACAYGDRIWICGTRGSLKYTPADRLELHSVSQDMIDFDAQRIFSYDASSGTFSKLDSYYEPQELMNTSLSGIVFHGDKGWAVGSQGIILSTRNGGQRWSIRKMGNLSLNSVCCTENRIFIACDNGLLLSSSDSGRTWQTVPGIPTAADLLSVTFCRDRGIITCSNGSILTGKDDSWTAMEIKEAAGCAINCAFFADGSNVMLAGNGGFTARSRDGGKTWHVQKFRKFNYSASYYFDEKTGLFAGTKGRIIYTEPGQSMRQIKKLSTPGINSFAGSREHLWAAGDRGMLMMSSDLGKNWHGIKGRSFAAFLINFTTPFIFIWVLFLMCYMFLPNTRVPFKEAATGAAVTSAVWVIFILLFEVYVKFFAKSTFAIYGALASIPLFLLMIYASSGIILYGAEVSWTLAHPETWKNLNRKNQEKREIHIYSGLAVLCHIYKKFESGLGKTEYKELAKICPENQEETDFFLQKFLSEKLILENSGGYIPANASGNIKVADVINSIFEITMKIPGRTGKNSLKEYVNTLFHKMSDTREKMIGDTTILDLIVKEEQKPSAGIRGRIRK